MKANRKFVNGDEAVSPVIAVILMVAITVVLAATVYLFVSGFGSEGNDIVTASFGAKAVDLPGGDGDTSDDVIELTYASGGDDLAATDVEIFVNGVSVTWVAASDRYAQGGALGTANNWCGSSPAGDTDDTWERGASIYMMNTTAATAANLCQATPATLGSLGNLDGVHQIKVVVRGQVVLDTNIEVHDNASA